MISALVGLGFLVLAIVARRLVRSGGEQDLLERIRSLSAVVFPRLEFGVTRCLLATALIVALLSVGCGAPGTSGTSVNICRPGSTWTPQPARTKGPLRPDTRSDAERQAEVDAAHQRDFDFAQRFIAAGCDPRVFPERSLAHADGAFPQGLDEAVAKADLIVTGRMERVQFTATQDDLYGAADGTLRVDQAIKGDASGDITLHQEGGPYGYEGGVIAHLLGDPVLLTDDHVLVLVTKSDGNDDGSYWSLYPVGKYYIRDGVVRVPEGNPCDSIDGVPLATVVDQIRSSLSRVDGQSQFPKTCDWTRF